MSITDTDIGNMALAGIGFSAQAIADLEEDSVEAVEVKFWYDKKRDELMEMLPWETLNKWLVLNLVEEINNEKPNLDWKFSYRYPPDCVRGMKILIGGQDSRLQESDSQVPYTLGQDEQGVLIYTDQLDACMKYTARRTTTAFWTNAFGRALAWFISMEIAIPLGRDIAFQVNAKAEFSDALAQAASNSFNEITDDRESEASGIVNRSGASSFEWNTDRSRN